MILAVHNIFDKVIRFLGFGDKGEVVENTWLGLGKMERELKAAYPADKGGDAWFPETPPVWSRETAGRFSPRVTTSGDRSQCRQGGGLD